MDSTDVINVFTASLLVFVHEISAGDLRVSAPTKPERRAGAGLKCVTDGFLSEGIRQLPHLTIHDQRAWQSTTDNKWRTNQKDGSPPHSPSKTIIQPQRAAENSGILEDRIRLFLEWQFSNNFHSIQTNNDVHRENGWAKDSRRFEKTSS